MPDAAGAAEAGYGINDHFFEARGIDSRNVTVSATDSMATNGQEHESAISTRPGSLSTRSRQEPS